MADIRKAEAYISAALAIEPRGIFYYFQAYIRHDYFARKSLNAYPDYREFLHLAATGGVTDTDIQFLEQLLGVDTGALEH
jgi:hypothetical protein